MSFLQLSGPPHARSGWQINLVFLTAALFEALVLGPLLVAYILSVLLVMTCSRILEAFHRKINNDSGSAW